MRTSRGWRRSTGSLLAKVEAMEPSRRVALDLDNTKIPVYGQQEQSAYNDHFESTC